MVSDKFRLTCSALLVIYFCGLGLFLTGFSTDYWQSTDDTHDGIWRKCFLKTSDSTWECNRQDVDYYEDWMKAVVAFLILALITAVVGGVIYMFVPLSASLQLISGVFTGVAVAVYAIQNSSLFSLNPVPLDWSFYVTVAGGFCLLVNGITLLALMGEEEDGFTMEMILPEPPHTKVGPE